MSLCTFIGKDSSKSGHFAEGGYLENLRHRYRYLPATCYCERSVAISSTGLFLLMGSRIFDFLDYLFLKHKISKSHLFFKIKFFCRILQNYCSRITKSGTSRKLL